jgi:hypothetical protein
MTQPGHKSQQAVLYRSPFVSNEPGVPLRVVRRDGVARPLRGEVTELDDQHAGKWRVIPVVRDDDRVSDTVHAFF